MPLLAASLAESPPPVSSPDPTLTPEEFAHRRRLRGVVPLALDMCELVEQARGKAPFYIQVGAHDGVTVDPLYDRIDSGGWGGLLIEPSSRYFDRLQEVHANRPQIALRHMGISDHRSEMELFRVSEEHEASYPPSVAGSASLNHDLLLATMIRHNPDAAAHIMSETIALDRLDTVLDEAGIGEATALIVDVEGHEQQVFDGVDLETLQPQLILFEHKHLTRKVHVTLARRIAAAGYTLFAVAQDTLCLRSDLAKNGLVQAIIRLDARLIRV